MAAWDRFNEYDELFLEASQQFEAHSNYVEQDDGLGKLLIEASQEYETSSSVGTDASSGAMVLGASSLDDIEWYLIDSECYDDMSENDFSYDQLMDGMVVKQKLISAGDDGSRFAEPVTEEDLLRKIGDAIPKSTRKSTKWAVSTWQEWSSYRKKKASEPVAPPPLDGISDEDLSLWLPRFIMEVRNQKGELYNGGTLYGLCAGIQRYIREDRVSNGGMPVDIYKDPCFSKFRCVFDSVLKDLCSKGVGVVAEVISEELEDCLWVEGLLDDTPSKLLDTIVYSFGLNFALRSYALGESTEI